jgi:hypothetical protein
VYKENILRYFQPFDHQGPFYTYFLYLPIYILPWVIFFIPACITLPLRWKTMSLSSKWLAWVLLALFLFFTLSGSRRSYYVLPLVPFAILFTADWMLFDASAWMKRQRSVIVCVAGFFVFLFAALDLLPAWYYSQFGVGHFAARVKEEANQIKPWKTWNIVLLDAESKLNFYLQLPPAVMNYPITKRNEQTAATLAKAWPLIINKPDHTIFISRKRYAPLLQPYFSGYHQIELSNTKIFFLKSHDQNAPIAFIPA